MEAPAQPGSGQRWGGIALLPITEAISPWSLTPVLSWSRDTHGWIMPLSVWTEGNQFQQIGVGPAWRIPIAWRARIAQTISQLWKHASKTSWQRPTMDQPGGRYPEVQLPREPSRHS